MGKILFAIPSPSGGHAFSSIKSVFSSRESVFFPCEGNEDDILRELKFVLERILARDDRHGWRTCMGGARGGGRQS
jgi:hypothetical protein